MRVRRARGSARRVAGADRDCRAGQSGRDVRLRLRASRPPRAPPPHGTDRRPGRGRVGRQLRRASPERCGLGRGTQPRADTAAASRSGIARTASPDAARWTAIRLTARGSGAPPAGPRSCAWSCRRRTGEYARVRRVVDQRVAEPPTTVVGDDQPRIGHALEGAWWQRLGHQRLDPRVLEPHADHGGHAERVSQRPPAGHRCGRQARRAGSAERSSRSSRTVSPARRARPASRRRATPGPSRSRTAGCPRSAHGCGAPHRRRRRPARSAWPAARSRAWTGRTGRSARRPPGSSRPAVPPGASPARITSGQPRGSLDQHLDHRDRRGVDPLQVVHHDHPRSARLDEPIDVPAGDLDQRRGDRRRVGGHIGAPRPPSRRTRRRARSRRSPRRTGERRRHRGRA